MKPLVSVIVTVYNTAPYLGRCLESLLNQTLREIEIVVVDDASSDGSLAIVEEYAARDERIKVIALPENTPGGTGIPSNRGIDTARGEYIGFTDGDDWADPRMFEILYRASRDGQADIAVGNFSLYDDANDRAAAAYDEKYWEGLPVGGEFEP